MLPKFMTWTLGGVAALAFAEVARFLAGEVRRRHAADEEAFPADPRRAARLTPSALARVDRAEFQRGVGLLARVDAGLAALLGAVFYQSLTRGVGGFVMAKGVLFCVALAMGPAQLLFLLPAALIGLQIRQPRASRALLEASVPVFVVSVLCGLWLLVAPKPKAPAQAAEPPAASAAPAAAEAPRGGLAIEYRMRSFSAMLPPGWFPEAEQPAGEAALETTTFKPREGGGASLQATFTRFGEPSVAADAGATDRALDEFRRSGMRDVPAPAFLGTLGGIGARGVRLVREGAEGMERAETWVAPTAAGFYTVRFSAPVERYAEYEPAFRMFMSTFRAAADGERKGIPGGR